MAPREIAIKLMEAVRVGDMSIEKFCSEFETLFNFNWPARDSEKNHIIFETLFDVVVYFTPFPEEKKTVYAGYRTEPEVLQAVRASLTALTGQPSNQPGRADARRLFWARKT
jgi:hypothetical protein